MSGIPAIRTTPPTVFASASENAIVPSAAVSNVAVAARESHFQFRIQGGHTMASSTAGSSAPGSSASKSGAQPASRESLLGLLDQYLDAVIEHTPSAVPLAANFRATEDGQPTKPGEGVWKTLAAITYRQSVVDPFTGEAGFFGIALENDGQRSLLGMRLKQQGGQITESETLLVRAGDHPIFTPENMLAPRPVWDVVLPESERSPRAKLVAIANSYFDGIVAGDPSIVPLHPDCNRVENGSQTTNNPPKLSRERAPQHEAAELHHQYSRPPLSHRR